MNRIRAFFILTIIDILYEDRGPFILFSWFFGGCDLALAGTAILVDFA